jgi:hypothetical protein
MADPIYLHLVPEHSPSGLSVGPFKALVIVDEPVATMWRNTVCAWLVESGCLYCCVWGEACEAWHDEVDHANICAFDGGTIPDDQFVMTTWHDKEPLSDALWFVGTAAEHPTVDLAQTVILHVARHERKMNLIEQYRVAISE